MHDQFYQRTFSPPLSSGGRKFRRAWTIILFLMALLPFSQNAYAINTRNPSLKVLKAYKYPTQAHITFRLQVHNYHDSNALWVDDANDPEKQLYLYINGERAIRLNTVWKSIENYNGVTDSKKEDFFKNSANNAGVLGSGTFSTSMYNGKVTIYNKYVAKSESESQKWATVDIDVVLENLFYGKDLKFTVKGRWLDANSNNTFYPITLNETITNGSYQPTSGWPTFSVQRKGNKEVDITATNLTPNEKYNGNEWKYRFIFAKSNTGYKEEPASSARYTILKYMDDNNTSWLAINGDKKYVQGAKTVYTKLQLSDNYQAYRIYPHISRYVDKYTVYPVANSTKTSWNTTLRYIRNYDKNTNNSEIWINGHPRPKNFTLSYDAWDKEVYLNWTPEVHNSAHVDANGTWVIFRRDGSSTTYEKIGEVKYNVNSYTDKTNIDYDTNYTYAVVFQPTAWNQEFEKPTDGEGLYKENSTTITRNTPFTNLNATTNLINEIEITCKYSPFPHASTSNKYVLQLYRRTAGLYSNDNEGWEPVENATHNITSAVEDSCKFSVKSENPCDHYEFRVSVEMMDITFNSPISAGYILGTNDVTSVTASRGTYNGTVRITWKVNQLTTEPTYFNVKRRPLGSKNESDYQTVYTTSGVASIYSYEDNTAQPGSYYQYCVESYSICKNSETDSGSTVPGQSMETDGFALATGIISGRISYGTGTAVEGVKVSLTTNDDVNSTFHSLKVNGDLSYTEYDMTGKEYASLFNGSWTVQTYFKVDKFNDRATFFKTNFMNLCTDKSGSIICCGSAWTNLGIQIKAGVFYNISFSYDKSDADNAFVIRTVDENGVVQKATFPETKFPSIAATKSETQSGALITFGNNWSNSNGTSKYTGYIDECRIWAKALTDEDIMDNYNRTLSGSEDGLFLYYKLDEGITGQTIAYDYSKKNGIMNGRHGTITAMSVSDNVPTEEQLSICGITDINGNYIITGIPFSGEGNSYTVRPTMGIHEFTPSKTNRYISAQSLVHNGIDFEDVSSFTVSGTVYYKDTNIPVEGVQFAVDGTPCTKDGAYVTSRSTGEFEISVPIGSHYISASLTGHTLANGNDETYNDKVYYPHPAINSNNEPVFNTIEFTKDITGLTFYDNTLVTIAGRVDGSTIEKEKPLGFGASNNNIGRAELKLTYGYNSKFNYNPGDRIDATEGRTFDVPADAKCSSTATTGYGENATTITIVTDQKTGEFAVKVPPLTYTVNSVTVKNSDISWTVPEVLDASNPQSVTTDSIEQGNGYSKFEYVAALKKCYISEPKVEVTQKDALAKGAFGEFKLPINSSEEQKDSIETYVQTAEFGIPTESQDNYTFGYPTFKQYADYAFDIKIYEEYVNNDTGDPENPQIKTTIPLSGTTLTFSNQMGTGAAVDPNTYEYIEELSKTTELTLDENGEGTYYWKAGIPDPNGSHTRTLKASYNNGSEQSWPKSGSFTGIVVGEISSGSNFVTAGPDEVAMIIRDPGGSGSSAYVEEGQSVTSTKTRGGIITTGTEVLEHASVGLQTNIITGSAVGAIVATSIQTDVKLESQYGLRISEEVETNTTSTQTVTTTKRISTSEGTEYVGSAGDVFIGSSTNYLFGKAQKVGVFYDENKNPVLDTKEIMSVGTNFTTDFMYSQNYVENVLIPNFVTLRNNRIKKVTKGEFEDPNYSNSSKYPIYISALDPESVQFGSNNYDKKVWGSAAAEKGSINGPSYRMILPKDAYDASGNIKSDYNVGDSIVWYNAQISTWEQVLANNEMAKVTAIQKRDSHIIANYSFDSGSSLSTSANTTKSKDFTITSNTNITVISGLLAGVTVNNCGLTVETMTETGISAVTADSDTEESSFEVGFTLLEDGDDDALSIDVLNAPDGFGPIFYTRGGQTSCPFEDEERTRYYEEGFVIQEKTMQIEKPHITAKETIKTGVPNGKPATFTVILENDSETDEDCWFNLNVVDDSNPNGAEVTMDGKNITDGRTILVPAGKQLIKTLQVSQTQMEVYEYKDLMVRISSICQPDNTGIHPEIADTLILSAYFQQTGSDVAIKAEQSALNTKTGSALNLTIYDYDHTAKGLTAIRLQTQREGDSNWTTQKEWDVNDLSTNGTFKYTLDMKDTNVFPDGQWNIRAITASDFGGGEEVYNYSEVLSFYKDMAIPQLISNPNPTNGVLTADSEISVTFNEDIRYSALTKDNFYITGELNDATVDHDVAMNLTGSEGAKTNASVNLDNRPFAINMWLRYTENGEIFAHGTNDNNIKVSVNENDNLVVDINGVSYTSENTLKKDKWSFLSFAYDKDSTINANYVYDDVNVILFNKKSVKAYNSVGKFTFGNGLTGQMHEISLWDNARSWSEALNEKNEKKTRYTNGLMGYWRLDEGHGSTATDYARSRTLTLPANSAWYLANKNYAMTLNGNTGTIMAINASNLATEEDESYAAELWFRAAETQQGTANIVGFNSKDKLDLYLSDTGQLFMTAQGLEYPVSTTDYRDNQWHHLALNVLKGTSGSATVYVDGVAKKQVSAANVPTLSTSEILLGGRYNGEAYDRPFTGAIDEVRVWHGQRTSDAIINRMYARVSEDTEGLVAYYPFEVLIKDAYGQWETYETMADQSTKKNGEAYKLSGTADSEITTENTAPLKTAPHSEFASFSFVGSDRKILIKLTDTPQRIEDCTISVTVRDVHDSHGNPCEPITWDVYVRQNQLLWKESEVSAEKHGTETVNFEVAIANNSGSTENWKISNLPSWLTVNEETGALPAVSSTTLKFTVDPSLNVGYYESVVYLTGSLGIAEPLVVKVNSTCVAPDWSVDPTDYEYTMNVNAQLKVGDMLSQDENDIVAAFRGDRCVGVASPIYFERYDAYYVLMNVYGNVEDVYKPLTYKVFDASTGNIHPNVSTNNSTVLEFCPDSFFGTMADPIIWYTTDVISENYNLVKGWQWISMYVTPTSNYIEELIAGVKDKTNYIVSEFAQWTPASNTLTRFRAGEMYKMQMSENADLTISGVPVDVESKSLTIRPSWNWIGYMAPGYISLNEAFADLAPEDGDVIKSQTTFATWNQSEWVGTLKTLVGGEGYQYYSMSENEREFYYPLKSQNGTSTKVAAMPENGIYSPAQEEIASAYSGNMSIIAKVIDFKGNERDDVEIRIVDEENNLRAISNTAVAGRHFITVAGDENGAMLRFIVNIDGTDYTVPGVMSYTDDAIVGTYNEPFLIDLSSPTGIGQIDVEDVDGENTYNVAGQRISNPMRHQVIVKGSRKVVQH